MLPMYPIDPRSPQSARPKRDLLLGIDPGLQRTGYAFLQDHGPRPPVLVEAGIVRLTRGTALADRLVELERSLGALMAEHQPGILACEELYTHYRHPRTAVLMAHARGVILALGARSGLEILPVAATHVKKLLTGSGHASKQQMQHAVASELRLCTLPEPHDVADAIAIALAGLRCRHAATVLPAPQESRT